MAILALTTLVPTRRARPSGSDRSCQGLGDADLVAAAISGKSWAADALYTRHARSTAGLVARLLGRTADVDDVLHDAFLDALRQLPRLHDSARFKPWLTQIAITKVRRLLRRRRLERALGFHRGGDDDAALERLAAPHVPPEVRADLRRVDAALRGLPSEQRVAWMLRQVEGMSLEETASLACCSLATVKRRIAAAQGRVDAVLGEKETQDG